MEPFLRVQKSPQKPRVAAPRHAPATLPSGVRALDLGLGRFGSGAMAFFMEIYWENRGKSSVYGICNGMYMDNNRNFIGKYWENKEIHMGLSLKKKTHLPKIK